MARAATCVYHPDRPAVANCYQCHKPVCEECRVIDAGRAFCSKKCASRYRTVDLHYAKEAAKPSKWRMVYIVICIVLALVILRFVITAGAGLRIEFLEKLDEVLPSILR